MNNEYQEDWQQIEQHVGVAVLDALQNQKNIITEEDIKNANVFEAIKLMIGGKDVWDDIAHIGRINPDMPQYSVKLKRSMSQWQADRTRDTMQAVRDSRLPQYALKDKIEYSTGGPLGIEAKILFKFGPSKQEIEAIAKSLAKYVSEKTGQQQKVEDISMKDLIRGPSTAGIGTQFFVRSQEEPGQNPILYSDVNYRLAFTHAYSREADVQGAVCITRESSSKLPQGTLEAYVESVRE